MTPEPRILLHLSRIENFNCVASPVTGLFLMQEFFCGYGVRFEEPDNDADLTAVEMKNLKAKYPQDAKDLSKIQM